MKDELKALNDAYEEVIKTLGLRLIAIHKSETFFGNESVIYANDSIILRFDEDRGDIFVNVAPAKRPDDSFSLGYILALVAPHLGLKRGVEVEAQALAANYDRIVAIFESDYYACYSRAYRSFENCLNMSMLETSPENSA